MSPRPPDRQPPGGARRGGGKRGAPGGPRRGGGKGDAAGGARRQGVGDGDGAGRGRGRGRPGRPDVPGGAHEPIGRDRARERADAPPRPARRAAAPPRPPLPDDEEPQLPRNVRREIERSLGTGRRARDVALALSIGSAAIDEQRPDVAVPMLAWAKHEAARVAAVREAYGVALYLAEEFAGALTELQAYRRLTGRNDQNHLVADCLRALGRDLDQVAALAEALVDDDAAPADRRAEAAIVWAAALADSGAVAEARAVLRRVTPSGHHGDDEHDLRVRYLAAELAERDGDTHSARQQFERVAGVDPDFLDVRERLARLGPG